MKNQTMKTLPDATLEEIVLELISTSPLHRAPLFRHGQTMQERHRPGLHLCDDAENARQAPHRPERLFKVNSGHIRGKALWGNRALPVISNQHMNLCLKQLCELCGFNQPVRIVKYCNGRRIEQVFPKYQLITTHCARRTFICYALSIGIPPVVVMRWTGHSDYKSMKPYIDITESAKRDAINLMERVFDAK